jgi:chromosome partitioning protein
VSVAKNVNRHSLPSADETIGAQAELLSSQLQSMSEALFPPTSQKVLRKFTSGEAARLIGISDSTLRKMTLAGEGPQPETTSNGRRLYNLSEINQIRRLLAQSTRGRETIEFVPTVAQVSICKSLPSPTSKAGPAKRQRQLIWHNFWLSRAIAF